MLEPPHRRELSDAPAAYEDALARLEGADAHLRQVAGFEAKDDRPILFVVPDGLIWYPTPDPQCVARTRNGPRCRNHVFDGQVWRWRGPFAQLDESWIGRLLSQTCYVHDDGRADYDAPEWCRIPIDPSLIDRLPW